MAEKVTIDRLVFELPGLGPHQAARIAEQIGSGLAGLSGEFTTLTVTLDDAGPDRLAARALAALRLQIR